MILVDSNVVSEAMKPEPHPSVRNRLSPKTTLTVLARHDWSQARPGAISAITCFA